MTTTNINRINFDKIHRIHSRQILYFMGHSMNDQPSKVEDLRNAVKAMARTRPDEFLKYYNLCVHRELPEGAGQQERDIAAMTQMMNDHVSFLEKDMNRRLDERMDIECKRAVPEFVKTANKIIEEAKGQFVTYAVKQPKKAPIELSGIPPKQFPKLIDLAKARKNILMVGPSGCGKTFVAGMIAEGLGMRFGAQSCSVGVSESNFNGWLLPVGKNGGFAHVPSLFVDIYENGGVFLIDEMDNADPNLLVFLNMALANKEFYLPQRFDSPVVKRHRDFVAVATANTFGGGASVLYSSRNALDAATLDRFKVGTVQMDYDDRVENGVIQNRRLLQWGMLIRTEISNLNLAKLMSTRVLIDSQEMMDDYGWTFPEIESAYFADWTPEEMAMIDSKLREFHSNTEAA